MEYWREKMKALFLSRRFKAALVALVAIVLQDLLGLTEDQATLIVATLLTWIVGDSISVTTSPKLEALRRNQ